MKLWYDGVALHALGTVSLVSEESTFEPPDGPQKEMVTLEFRFDSWLQSYADNRTVLQNVQAALRKPERVLKVTQELLPGTAGSTELPLYEQNATVAGSNFPADVNEWGTYHQQIRVKFKLERHNLTLNASTATLTPSTGTAVTLGHVFTFKEQVSTDLFEKKHTSAEHIGGSVEAAGEFLGNMDLTIDARRTALRVLKEALLQACDSKTVTLVYGDFNRVVKVLNRDVQIDQANTKIAWKFSCIYTRFPNESDYALADYQVDQSASSDTGDLKISITGRILATSEARARAKLALIKAAVIAEGQFAYTAAQLEKDDVRVRRISSDSATDAAHTRAGDGEEYIELSFTAEYLRRDYGHLSYKLSVDDQDDAPTGLLRRTYSGSVVCGYTADTGGGASGQADKAYWNAVKRARTLGENKHPIRTACSIKRDDRLTRSAGTVETVKVDFSFSYLLRGSRIHMEVQSAVDFNTFGEDSESVSGSVVGGDEDDADLFYENFFAATTAGRLVRGQRKETSQVQLQPGTYSTSPADASLAAVWAFSAAGGDYSAIATRLSFSFSMHKEKGGIWSIKSGMKIANNYTTLTRLTTVEGSFYSNTALTTAAVNKTAGNKLDLYLNSLGLGAIREETRGLDREYYSPLHDAAAGQNLKVDFAMTYESAITGDDTVLSCKVKESIQFSGTRNVVIAIPDRDVEVQQLGNKEGSRTLSGEVVAANETVALKWVRKQRATPYAANSVLTGIPVAPGAAYDEPPTIDIDHDFNPFTDGELRLGDAAKAPRLVRVTFTFMQIIPNYPYTTA